MQIYTKNLIKTNSIRYLLGKYLFKMNKKLIRLTESDLHKVIKESVNKVLTELDWKTYDSAMRKAAAKKDFDRAGRFGRASKDALNRDFGTHDTVYDKNYNKDNVP